MGSWFNSLRKTRERFSGALQGLFASPKPDEATAEELADLLITADVPMRLVQTLSKELEKSASRKEPLLSTFQRVLVGALGQNPPLEVNANADAPGGAEKAILLANQRPAHFRQRNRDDIAGIGRSEGDSRLAVAAGVGEDGHKQVLAGQ